MLKAGETVTIYAHLGTQLYKLYKATEFAYTVEVNGTPYAMIGDYKGNVSGMILFENPF